MKNQVVRTILFSTISVLLPFLGLPPAEAQTVFDWTNFAGLPGNSGAGGDGTSSARFDSPRSVAADGAGNVYVADTGNSTIRKVTPGQVVSTLAGSAGERDHANGSGAAARFDFPTGIAVDGAGNVYVADSSNNTIRKVTPSGAVTTFAGTPGGIDFAFPRGVVADAAGNVYVSDTYNHAIRKVTPGGTVTTLAGSAGESGDDDGIGSAARFNLPRGLAVDSAGNVYVADTENHTIRRVTPEGAVTTLAGSAGEWGDDDGIGDDARFDSPSGVAVDGAGNVYVADTYNHTIRKVTPEGVVTTIGGSPGISGNADGAGNAARFDSPMDVAVGPGGSLFVVDKDNHRISWVSSGAVPPVVVVPPVPTPPARAIVQRPRPFQTTLVGKRSRAQTLRISNQGGGPLGGLRVVAAGKARRDFLLSQPARKSLAPGASTAFKVSFRPRAKGVRKAVLTVRSSAPAVNAALSGRARAR